MDSASRSGPATPGLLRSLRQLVRGLTALFWALPLCLIVSIQNAASELFSRLYVLPPVAVTGLMVYGLVMLGRFRPDDKPWRRCLDSTQVFAIINLGLSPFIFMWSQFPESPFFQQVMLVLAVSGILYLAYLNRVLQRLTSLLPDEALRNETHFFSMLNLYLILAVLIMAVLFLVTRQWHDAPIPMIRLLNIIQAARKLIFLFLLLLPLAMTMTLLWKIKEVVLNSVFGLEERHLSR